MRPYLLACLVALASPVAAAAEERVEAVYEVLWGGLEIGRFDVRLRTGERDYRMAYRAETTGFVGWLFPFVSEGTSEGALTGPGPVPRRYAGGSRRRDGPSHWTVHFAPSGEAEQVEVATAVDEQRDPVPASLRRAPDPLALALQATTAAGPGIRFAENGFDGKRAVRFELACDQAERAVEPSVVPVALDRALACTLDGEVEAGRSRRWDNPRDERRAPAQILLSREIASGRYWPVRVEAATRFGTVIARLIGLDDGREVAEDLR